MKYIIWKSQTYDDTCVRHRLQYGAKEMSLQIYVLLPYEFQILNLCFQFSFEQLNVMTKMLYHIYVWNIHNLICLNNNPQNYMNYFNFQCRYYLLSRAISSISATIKNIFCFPFVNVFNTMFHNNTQRGGRGLCYLQISLYICKTMKYY